MARRKGNEGRNTGTGVDVSKQARTTQTGQTYVTGEKNNMKKREVPRNKSIIQVQMNESQ